MKSQKMMLALLAAGSVLPMLAKDVTKQYQETDLVSDQSGMAAVTDPNLVNPWGLVASATSPWWVSDNGTGLSTVYTGTGTVSSLVVTIPNSPGVTDPSAPTGIVVNTSSTDFLTAPGKPAHFLWVAEGGQITGWSGGSSAVLLLDNSATAVYKGAAIGQINGANVLYAANFTAGKVEVYDGAFHPVALNPGAFQDGEIPSDFHPFNIANIGGVIYVAYAQSQPGSIDEVHGPGKGFVEAYSPDGTLQHRLQWGAWFNAPWGLAQSPSDFGKHSGEILVGQFGSGKIAAFDAGTGQFKGYLKGDKGPIKIDGLWAIQFGNGAGAGPANTLYFTAGTDDEAHGLFGTLTAASDSGNSASGGN